MGTELTRRVRISGCLNRVLPKLENTAESISANSCARTFALGWLTLIMLLLTPPAMSQSARNSCKVFDAELQGNYSGGCAGGLAEGPGEAGGIAQYKGDFKAGKKHGKGVKTWPSSGDHYEGEFNDDRKDGTGIYTWGPRSPWAGEKYTGSYLNDLRQGYGVYMWPSGDRYTGPWANDAATGPATPTMIARARRHAEVAAAVRKTGIRICRQMTVGIATREWISGTVLLVEADTIVLRIIDAGQYGHVIGSRPVNIGEVLRDEPEFWTPC